MAPSIISHFRPHRRVGSTPTSPRPPLQPLPTSSPNLSAFQATSSSPTSPAPQSTFSASTRPPILPPITRVTSHTELRKRSHEYDEPTLETESPHQSTEFHDASSPAPKPFTSFVLPPIQRVASHDDTVLPDTTTSALAGVDATDDPALPSQSSPVERSSRLSTTPTATRASFADFGRTVTAPALMGSPEIGKPPQTPSNSSQTQSGRDASRLHPQSYYTHSPASSVSSFHKTASSTNLAVESSPASSRSAQGSSDKPSTSGHRMSRAKLNLLNPVSLLKRRRTSQMPESATENNTIPVRRTGLPGLGLPADYDPRIKGKGVHNFDDGPRPRRNYSTNDMAGMSAGVEGDDTNASRRRSSIPALDPLVLHDDSTPGPEREHTPVFVENFEETRTERNEDGVAAVHRESLANSKFLARMSKQFNLDTIDFAEPRQSSTRPSSEASVTPPATSCAPLASSSTPQRQSNTPSQNPRTSGFTDNTSARVSSDQSTARSSMSNETKATSPPQSPGANVSQRPSRLLEAPTLTSSSSLSHLPSTASRASRFSFQLNSAHSIEQEKALEEKHKAKHASTGGSRDSRFDDFDEEGVDYDAMAEDMGGYEEDIPTMGEDDDLSVFGGGLGNKRLSSFKPVEPAPEIDVTRASSHSQYTVESGNTYDKLDEQQAGTSGQGLGLQNAGPLNSQNEAFQDPPSAFGDMYFDDGIIDNASITEGGSGFDETLLDSPVQAKPGDASADVDFQTPKYHQVGVTNDGQPNWSSELHGDINDVKHTDAEEQTPKKSSAPRQSQQLGLHQLPAIDTGLNAYHNALAEAASRAARDGKFSRHSSIMTASSVYSNTRSPPDANLPLPQSRDDDERLGTRQAFEEIEEEDDIIVAEANAEALASEDCDFYGQEFGFFRHPNSSGDSQVYSGGYFGQPDLLGVSMRNREPNLTPITERSEYSTRNSVICGTPWGPPSAGPWGPSGSASQQNLSSPGLKEIAASMGMDDEDMTLSQLLRLRKETFGSAAGSGPHSTHVSSSSNDSSPTSQLNASPLANRVPGPNGWVHPFDVHSRRPSEPELPQVDEEEIPYDIASTQGDSPIRDNVTLGTARAILHKTRAARQKRRESAEVLAQEYTDIIHTDSSPVPLIAEPIRPTPPSSPLEARHQGPRGNSSSPTVTSPAERTVNSPFVPDPVETPRAERRSSPMHDADTTGAQDLPSPPTTLLQRFAQRPMPDAYRKAQSPPLLHHQRHGSSDSSKAGAMSVAYVCEVDDDGEEQWFLEKRRQKSTGELVVVSREPVENGKI
ncbi:MAG: hypothetical protein Q9162_002043 [Coniocarpon cinnabarinum]